MGNNSSRIPDLPIFAVDTDVTFLTNVASANRKQKESEINSHQDEAAYSMAPLPSDLLRQLTVDIEDSESDLSSDREN
jgi:hypothetical protein